MVKENTFLEIEVANGKKEDNHRPVCALFGNVFGSLWWFWNSHLHQVSEVSDWYVKNWPKCQGSCLYYIYVMGSFSVIRKSISLLFFFGYEGRVRSTLVARRQQSSFY